MKKIILSFGALILFTPLLAYGVSHFDKFETYSLAELNGQDGGSGWSGAWSGSSDFIVQNSVASQGSKAVKIDGPASQLSVIERTFTPRTTGTVRWAQRKDAPDRSSNFELRSGNTLAAYVAIGSATQPESGGPDWVISDGVTATIVADYTVGTFDEVEMQFDTVTDQFRIRINNGPYSIWKNFLNPVDSLDRVHLEIGPSGDDVGANYWDNIRFDN